MFLNFYRKNLWFHNYFIILQRHRRFDGKDVCNRSIFLPFSPVFLLKAKVHCSDFFVFAIFIIVFWCFQAFLWVFYTKYSDYCTRFLVCPDAFLHIYGAFSFYLCNCLPFVRVYFADDVYLVIFPLCRLRFVFGAVFAAAIFCFYRLVISFKTSILCVKDGYSRVMCCVFCTRAYWVLMFASSYRQKYRLKPHCLVCFTSNKLSTYQQCVFSVFRFENDFVEFFTVKRLTR